MEVATPAFLARGVLKKMNITEDNALWKQIFRIDKNRCLRPMLAPNLYFLLGHLQRLWSRAICPFEISSSWPKESKGAGHTEEFTMLDLVELGCQDEPHNGCWTLPKKKCQGKFTNPRILPDLWATF